MSNDNNLQDLLNGAQDDGFLDPNAANALQTVDLGQMIQGNLGISADDIDSNEVFGLFILLDDSTSIRMGGNTQIMRDGYNMILDALVKSGSRDDIIVSTMTLNGGILQPPTALVNAIRLDSKNYNPSGGTPLFDQSLTTGALVTAKRQEFASTGASFRGVVLIASDGEDVGSRSNPRQVKAVLDSLQAQEVIQVLALGIDDGHTNFQAVFESMGVLPENVLTVNSDPSSIRKAFGVISRATVAASQGGSVSQSGGLGGFGVNP